jgi:hypothetical protein
MPLRFFMAAEEMGGKERELKIRTTTTRMRRRQRLRNGDRRIRMKARR